MYESFKIVKVDSDYCDYLREFDSKVCYNAGKKELRPFIGVLFMVAENEYFAPLSSRKLKHERLRNTIDLLKIDHGRYGVINFNNMIPVMENNYEEMDLTKKSNDENEMKRIVLLNNQLRWLTSNKKEILKKAKLLYNLYKKKKLPPSVENRCCNFLLLEKKCQEYNN